MKRIWILVLAMLSLTVCLSGCRRENKLTDGIPKAGSFVEVQEGDTFRVVSSEIENGRISVVLELHFDHRGLSHYKKISIHECEYDVPEIVCTTKTIKELSGSERVVQPYVGFVSLEFTHRSITESQDVDNYCLEILDNEGNVARSMLG